MPTLFIQHHQASPPGSTLDVLQAQGHSIRIIKTHEGDAIPDSLDDLNAIISCGGPQSVRASDAAMEAEYELIRAAHQAEVPVLGLCLGAQMVAHALGGTVDRMEEGPEVGFHEVALTPTGREDPLFKGIPWWCHQFEWHEDAVMTPPPDARILASSKRCPIQAFAVGTSTYAIQYHPEYTHELVVEHWNRPDPFTEAGGGIEELSRQTERHFADFQRHGMRFFESVALFLMPADRLNSGRAREPVEH
jgi:GMP synthase (glutamine-hydrolysing)